MDLRILVWLQELRTPFGDSLCLLLSKIGASSVAFVAIGLVYWCIHKRTGEQILLSLSIFIIMGQLLKNTFCVYRPWVRSSTVIPVSEALSDSTGYSFPSLHGQFSMNVYGTMGCNVKRKSAKIVLFAIPIMVGFSRIYLGVHTPQDVLVGLLMGTLAVVFSHYVFPKLEKHMKYITYYSIIGGIAVVLFLVFTTLKSYPMDYINGELIVSPVAMIADCYLVSGIMASCILGFNIEKRFIGFTTPRKLIFRLLRGILGAVFIFGVNYAWGLTKPLLHPWIYAFMKFFLLISAVMIVWPFIFTRLEKMCTKNGEKN